MIHPNQIYQTIFATLFLFHSQKINNKLALYSELFIELLQILPTLLYI